MLGIIILYKVNNEHVGGGRGGWLGKGALTPGIANRPKLIHFTMHNFSFSQVCPCGKKLIPCLSLFSNEQKHLGFHPLVYSILAAPCHC